MDYIEVAFEITPFSEEIAECITAEIAELGFESFYTEEPFLKGYIQQEVYNPAHLKCLLSGYMNLEGIKVSYSANLIKAQNWNAVWEAGFEPIVMDNAVTVKASFHKMPLTKYNIRIDPNMAFGTGHHQTTSMMLKTLLMLNGEGAEKLPACDWKSMRNKQVLDMGTGTGVLGFLAAKMKAKRPVHAIDVDLNAVNSAKDNAWKNRLHEATHILYGDASLIQADKYDLILANINRNILLEDMSTYARGMRAGGILAMSGFYTGDIPLLMEEAARQGLVFVHQMEIEGWACLLLRKKFAQ